MAEKIKTEWNLGLLYKSDADPEIEKDLSDTEKAFAAFEKKYKGKDFTSSAEKLKKALEEADRLNAAKGYKAWRYFNFKKDIDSQNEKVQARLTQVRGRLTDASNRLTFFKLALGKIPPALQKKYLKDQGLAGFRYELELVFKSAKYNLSEGEEQLASLLSQPGMTAWTNGRNKLLTAQTIDFKGKKLPVEAAAKQIPELASSSDRAILQKKLNETLKTVSHFAEGELNAVYLFKKIMDERRGFPQPYSETVMSYQNDDASVEALVALITRSFKISQRFYSLQAKLQGKARIGYQDRSVKLGKVKRKFDFESAVEIVRESFRDYGDKYAEIFQRFLDNGQFDVYPRKGKRGGAYCSPGIDMPTFVLLNHSDDLDSVSTLAHEMGHAIHTELSKGQPYRYQDYVISVAEVASTFFEQVMQERLEKELDKEDYASFLHSKILDDINTIFVQAAFFNAELEMHERVRKEGMLSAQEFARIMARHMGAAFGKSVEVTEEDGYFFVRLSHLRYFFYVYSYAYGQIISKALFAKWKEDKSYAGKIEKFLSAGGSMSPKDIFKSIGIDTTDPAFFDAGLKSIERDIKKLERLVGKK